MTQPIITEHFLAKYHPAVPHRGDLSWRFYSKASDRIFYEIVFRPKSRQFDGYFVELGLGKGVFRNAYISPKSTKKLSRFLPPEAIAACTNAALSQG